MSERIQNVCPKEYNGKTYRSTLEAETAKTLDSLGIPYTYEEKVFKIFEGFKSQYQKDKIRDIVYKPDFIIGNIIIECKGFETPEWKIKKKLVFKYLMDNEPHMMFYQTHDAKKSLLEALDNHWSSLGYAIKVISKVSSKNTQDVRLFESIHQALDMLGLKGKPIGALMRSFIGSQYVYGYQWKLEKLKL